MTTPLSEWASKELLGPSVPRPPEVLARQARDAVAFAEQHGAVVAKASGVAHKSDAGLVRVGLDADGVAAAFDELAAAGDGSVLVAAQVRDAELELLVGGLRDPVFGPLVTVGIGGIAAELFGDVAFVLAPPEPGELARALDQLRGRRLLDGVRGRPAVDHEALGAVVAAVAQLLVTRDDVVEVDCNPVLVAHGAPVVADALVVLDGPTNEQEGPRSAGRTNAVAGDDQAR